MKPRTNTPTSNLWAWVTRVAIAASSAWVGNNGAGNRGQQYSIGSSSRTVGINATAEHDTSVASSKPQEATCVCSGDDARRWCCVQTCSLLPGQLAVACARLPAVVRNAPSAVDVVAAWVASHTASSAAHTTWCVERQPCIDLECPTGHCA